VSAAAISVLLLLGPAAPASAQGYDYGYTLSWERTDPLQNARAPFAGVDSVWLWVDPDCVPDFTFDRFVAEVSGELEVLQFIPEPDVTNSGTASELDLTVSDCLPVDEERTLGVFVVSSDGSPQELCFGGAILTWDCQAVPVSHGSAGLGCRAGAGPVCRFGFCGIVDYVVPESWARVRAMYR
jgi:hypothetical protein